MIKKVTQNLNSPKASGPDCIPVVALKNCEPELTYILAELLNMCLKVACFGDCWKVSSVVLVFKNVGERSTAKNYRPVSLLSVVAKVFEKLVNNRIVDHLEKYGLFNFQYGFRSSQSTADLLTVVCDRIARAFRVFCILHELGSKMHLGSGGHWDPLSGFSGGPGGKASGRFTIYSLKIVLCSLLEIYLRSMFNKFI